MVAVDETTINYVKGRPYSPVGPQWEQAVAYWTDADGKGAEGLEWEVPSPAPFHTFENPPKLDATATRIVGGGH